MTDTPMPRDYDAVIIGGGPAGTTLATLVQRSGQRCLVLERAKFPRYHIGESLIPHTYGVLDKLGVLPRLEASDFPVKHSVRFVSPSGDESTPFYFSETIDGARSRTWQVERSEFDLICLDNARASGVDVCTSIGADALLFDGDRAVGVRTRANGGEARDVRARVVVDASGHSTVIGSQLGLRQPVPGLDKASIWGYYRGGTRLPGIDAGETTIFVLDSQRSWAWYIPLPNDIVSVGVVAAPDRLYGTGEQVEDVFEQIMRHCSPLSERLAPATRVGKFRGSRRLAYRNRQTCGDGWVMVGDARAFLDPVYSSGLYLALSSADLAAESVAEALTKGDVGAENLGRFEPRLAAGVEVIRRLIHAFYDPGFSFGSFVKRFPDHRRTLIDCLVGDVIDKDMTGFTEALEQMTPPPPRLDA